MSFRKIQLIDPKTIGCPESGYVYFGRDSFGFWEKLSDCSWNYLITGGTSGNKGGGGTSGSSGKDGTFYGTSGTSGQSGSSGKNGSSGTSGRDGTSGTSGKSGSSGISGTSGTSGTSGVSGSSGITGTSGSSGLTGTSGSSGQDGNFLGTSGSSGYSGGYGGATRRWSAVASSPLSGQFCGSAPIAGTNFTILNNIQINKTDADAQILLHWMNGWINGTLKIENRLDATNFGIYYLNIPPTMSGNVFIFTGFNIKSGNGSIINGAEYLISFVDKGNDLLWSGSTVGNMWSTNSGNVGINEINPTTLLYLKSKEIDDVVTINTTGYTTSSFINYIGEEVLDTSKNIILTGSTGSLVGLVKIAINGTDYWMPYYSMP